ncbi:hypothetical protein BGX20_003647, partial [Mortierella sp. AD010]
MSVPLSHALQYLRSSASNALVSSEAVGQIGRSSEHMNMEGCQTPENPKDFRACFLDLEIAFITIIAMTEAGCFPRRISMIISITVSTSKMSRELCEKAD